MIKGDCLSPQMRAKQTRVSQRNQGKPKLCLQVPWALKTNTANIFTNKCKEVPQMKVESSTLMWEMHSQGVEKMAFYNSNTA